MRTLFLRIFLSFWLAMILIVGITVTVVVTDADRRLGELEGFDAPTLIQEASRTLEEDGEDGLREWLEDNTDEITGILLFIVDDQGDELLGRELPPDLMRRLSHRDARRMHLPRNYRPPRFMPRFVGPDGREYTVLLAPNRPGPFGFQGFGHFRLVVFSIALVVSAVMCFFLARYLSRPVGFLQTATHELARGNLDARVGKKIGQRRDELGVLARDFDEMAEQLRNLITARQQLLRDISHELRSPLTRLRLALGLAARRGTGAEKELNRIEKEAGRLEQLIGQILNLSRLDAGNDQLRRESIDLSALIDVVVEDARFEGEPKGCRIDWDSGPECTIQGDPDLLRSAIENVVRNAVRYTADNSSVEINLSFSDDRSAVSISTRDHGEGVPESELERIFEPFHRVSESRDRKSGGEGIGLAIAKRVVVLHRGQIVARNVRDGGLEVLITLPRNTD